MAKVVRNPDEMEEVHTLAPAWLEAMLETKFFAPCGDHHDMPRNERNMFCADCSEHASAFCIYCRSKHHADHRVIQVRRSSYHEVVRVSEIEEFIDVKGVHTYVINSAKVFFLNERPQPKGIGAAAGKAAASPYFCEVCSRSLLYEFRFCSIGCKLTRIKSNADAIFMLGEHEQSNMSNILDGENAGTITKPSSGGDVQEVTKDSGSIGGDGLSTAKDAGNGGGEGPSVVKDAKPISFRPPHRNRKGIPHRAPFF